MMGEIYNISVTTSEGNSTTLIDYAGKTLLIVNVASNCGFTPQYIGLQRLYEQYKGIGFEVLGFPCNDFGGQEPGTIEEIKQFCLSKFGVQFEMFDKVDILGPNKHPLFELLTDEAPMPGDVKWNFEKFIISRDGRVIGRFPSNINPEAFEIRQMLEQELYK
jgi:glutathione peroxidase